MSIAAKNQKQKKEEQYAHYLYQIRTKGEQGILYADILPGQRHPYTQEVVQMARSRGMTQTYIGGKCGVSQSQVSKWEGGVDKATEEQLRPLIRKLSKLAPGKEFHHAQVTREFIRLPDNLINKMCADYINKEIDKSYYRADMFVTDSKESGIKLDYKSENLPPVIDLRFYNSRDEELSRIAKELFSNDVFNGGEGDTIWGAEGDYADAFKEYVSNNTDVITETTEIQLCGSLLLSENKSELYQLVSNKLVLLTRATSSETHEVVTHCEVFDSADELLVVIKNSLNSSAIENWRTKLIEAGYILNGVKTLY